MGDVAQHAITNLCFFTQNGYSIYDDILMYLQSHHLDLEYYDALFEPGAYLNTHAEHLAKWHTGMA